MYLEKGPSVERTLHALGAEYDEVCGGPYLLWLPGPRETGPLESRASFPCRKLLKSLAQSFKQSFCYLRQYRAHPNERTKDLKTLYFRQKPAQKDIASCPCNGGDGLQLSGLVGVSFACRLPTHVGHCCGQAKMQWQTKTRTLSRKMGLHLLISQR